MPETIDEMLDRWGRQNVESMAVEDYQEIVGKVIFPRFIVAYIGDTDDQQEFFLGGVHPFKVRYGAHRQDLARWMDREYLDPIWDVEPVFPDELQAELGLQLRSIFTYGHTYRYLPVASEEGEEMHRRNYRYHVKKREQLGFRDTIIPQ